MARREILAEHIPSFDTVIEIAGFSFQQFNDPLNNNEGIWYSFQPANPVRQETFLLWWDNATMSSQDKYSATGVLESVGNATIMGLIEALKAQGYELIVGSRELGGFNPYDHPNH